MRLKRVLFGMVQVKYFITDCTRKIIIPALSSGREKESSVDMDMGRKDTIDHGYVRLLLCALIWQGTGWEVEQKNTVQQCTAVFAVCSCW